jgi:3-oxoacyl-[acyl-carrier protein] reductase
MRLKDKVALVTGGGSGIGKEICLLFAKEGAQVAVNDIVSQSIEKTIQDMGEFSSQALALKADVSDSSQVKNMFAELMTKYGRIDILVNNAGIAEVSKDQENDLNRVMEAQLGESFEGQIKTHWAVTENLSDEDWDKMLRVHLYGTFYCTREALKIMSKNNYGRIINMASVAATLGLESSPHYSAAKGGILSLTRAVAREVGSRSITVNAIAPGLIETPMTDVISPIIKQAWVMSTPAKRIGTAYEVATAALYLASDESSFFTGQILSPSGGCWMP